MTIEEKSKYLGCNKIGILDLDFLVYLLSKLPVLYMSQEKKKFKEFNSITLDEIKKDAINFYSKYFDIHNVECLSLDSYMLNNYSSCYDFFKNISPYEIPVELVFGHSMVSYLNNALLSVTDNENRILFDSISLGSDLTKISSSAYINEISDTQLESRRGFCEDYLNRKVVSLFLEKLSAYEIDPSLEILKAQERMRFAHMYDCIRIAAFSIVDKKQSVDHERAIESFMYVNSCLIAEKLFEDYLNCKSQEKRDSYIQGIQNIYDGKISVEDFISSKGANLNNSTDLKMLMKHINS